MKKAAMFLWLFCLVAFAIGANEPPVGVGGVKDSVGVGAGWVNIGTGSRDVNLSTLGQDLIAGEYWTPVVDFSSGTKYYFDPDQAVSGDGTLENPFRGLGWEVYDDRVIERRTSLGGAVANAGAVVGANDVCVLLEGDHGKIQFNRNYFDGHLGVVGMPGQTATFDYIKVLRGNGYYFEDLTANKNERSGGFWDDIGDTTVSDATGGPYFVRAQQDTNGNGVADNMIFKDLQLGVASASVSNDWTAYDWNSKAVNGIYAYGGSAIHVQGCKFETVKTGIKISGTSTDHASRIHIINNTGTNFCGDAATFARADSSTLDGNSFVDFFVTNEDHVDMFQGTGTVLGVDTSVFRNNRLIAVSDPGRDVNQFASYIGADAVGIVGFAFTNLGLFSDLDIYNNIVHVQGTDGAVINAIAVNGGSDIMTTNNTVVGWDKDGDAKQAYIYISASCTDCETNNNIAGKIDVSLGGASSTASNNSVYIRDFTDAGFTSWTVDGDPTTFDFSLASGSENIDAGTTTSAPLTDIIGTCRPYGGIIDIGAYEYNDGGECGFPPLAFDSFASTAAFDSLGNVGMQITAITSEDATTSPVFWEEGSSEPKAPTPPFSGTEATTHFGRFDSGITAAIADADSGGIILSWTNPASTDATMYRIQMQSTSGAAWATVANVAASLETWTHEAGTALEEPARGEPTYRVNGFFFTGTDTTWGDVAVLTERFMNQANRVYCRLYADDGVTVVSSGVDSELFIAQVEESGGGALPGSPTHHWDSMTSDDLTLSGDVITAWDDKVGDWDWVQYGTGVTGPYYRASNQLNGNTAAYFDGTSYMRRTSGYVGGADYTVAFAFDMDATGAIYTCLYNEAASHDPKVAPIYWDGNIVYIRQNGRVSASTKTATTGHHTWVASFDVSAGTVSCWLDGVQVLTDSAGVSSYTSATRAILGGTWYGESDRSFTGIIAEAVIYSTTSTHTEAQAIDTYFERWD